MMYSSQSRSDGIFIVYHDIYPRCLSLMLNKGAAWCINAAIFHRSGSHYAAELKFSASNYISSSPFAFVFSLCYLTLPLSANS